MNLGHRFETNSALQKSKEGIQAMDSLVQIASLLNPNEIYEIAFKVTAAVGVILSAFGASIAFFLKKYWDGRDRQADKKEREIAAKESEHLKQRDILYESLKWFEGGTQKRSIGIAVVNTSWNGYKEFRPLWIEVFLNQAIYLLTTSEEKTKFHEHDNLRRIMDLLVREKTSITEQSKILLTNTLLIRLLYCAEWIKRAKSMNSRYCLSARGPTRRSRGRGVMLWPVSPSFVRPRPLANANKFGHIRRINTLLGL
ncbi:MAG: hypothetical protein ACOYMG_05555, partial [Candidatus Methylumidiphilus sp.]